METGASETVAEAKPAVSTGQLAQQRVRVVNAILGSIESVRQENDDALADMREFSKNEPDMVMQAVSAHSARCIEIIVQIGRIEVVHREWKPVREETEKILAELKSQFQIASRAMAMRQLDWDMSGRGQV